MSFLRRFGQTPLPASPTRKRVGPFLATRPWVRSHAVQLAKSLPASVSFAQTAFHMLHAFRFMNTADEPTYARYHWEPQAGVAGQTLEELQKHPPSYLFDELQRRTVAPSPVVFNLVLQLAGEEIHWMTQNAPLARRSPTHKDRSTRSNPAEPPPSKRSAIQ